MPRPAVSAEPIDPVMRSKLEKLERILSEDYALESGCVIRIMNHVFENFVEQRQTRKKPASPTSSANNRANITRELIAR